MATIESVRVRQAEAAIDALKIVGEDLLGEAQRRAPIEEGTLRASGELTFVVNGISFDGQGAYGSARLMASRLARRGALKYVEAVVSFNEVYARRQHEELEWHHPLGGQAKYLESVVLERGTRYEAVIKTNIGRAA